ncbi:MAG: phosphate acyltransferase PlsX [Bacteroidota bacterium]|nr:phosphate acyltransferase PlsX [Bacteroidota bacterium]
MRIGIDIMGGDYAPNKVIEGVLLALDSLSKNIELFLFGPDIILNKLGDKIAKYKNVKFISCTEVIEMNEHPTKAFKEKSNSSIAKGFSFLKNNQIDGFASAGNTGAVFVGSFYTLKPITGILRPCISAILPKENGGVTLLLDVGANADCKAEVLAQFGFLGALFAENVCNISSPKVALLNLGEEESKGSISIQNAYQMMKKSNKYKFIGNIEGSDLLNSKADVIVCDGFTGNIVLKQLESFYKLLKKRNIIDSYFDKLNYENYGGTPILGLNKPVIIGHGMSNEIAIKNMILLTRDTINAHLAAKFKIS